MTGFGSQFADHIAIASFTDGQWSTPELSTHHELHLHAASHALHYGSTCFEGLKAYRHADGSVHIFRLDRHVARMQNSARLLCLPEPGTELLQQMISSVVDRARDQVPEYPASLYLRPVLLGMDPNIGSAARPSNDALLFILASPVGNYFKAGERPLRLWVEDHCMRSTPEFGEVKTGGNYASALRHIMRARKKHDVDQVLFCPGQDVQETGAANFLLLRDKHILTKRLDGSILPGITRDSILRLAEDSGYRIEERDFTISEMLEFVRDGEAALSGTAAALAGVGMLLYGDHEYPVFGGQVGPNTVRLRQRLAAIQSGAAPDRFEWLHPV